MSSLKLGLGLAGAGIRRKKVWAACASCCSWEENKLVGRFAPVLRAWNLIFLNDLEMKDPGRIRQHWNGAGWGMGKLQLMLVWRHNCLSCYHVAAALQSSQNRQVFFTLEHVPCGASASILTCGKGRELLGLGHGPVPMWWSVRNDIYLFLFLPLVGVGVPAAAYLWYSVFSLYWCCRCMEEDSKVFPLPKKNRNQLNVSLSVCCARERGCKSLFFEGGVAQKEASWKLNLGGGWLANRL